MSAAPSQLQVDQAHDSALQDLRAVMQPSATPAVAHQADPVADLIDVATVFLALCDSGQVRSRRTRAKAIAALAALQGGAT